MAEVMGAEELPIWKKASRRPFGPHIYWLNLGLR